MREKRKIILASHGALASGLEDSLNFIMGGSDEISTLCAFQTENFNLEKEVKNIIKNHDYEQCDLYVFTDLFGGSINNEFLKYLIDYDFHLISNVNLAILLEFVLSKNIKSESDIVEKIDSSNSKVLYCNTLVKDISCFDEIGEEEELNELEGRKL